MSRIWKSNLHLNYLYYITGADGPTKSAKYKVYEKNEQKLSVFLLCE